MTTGPATDQKVVLLIALPVMTPTPCSVNSVPARAMTTPSTSTPVLRIETIPSCSHGRRVQEPSRDGRGSVQAVVSVARLRGQVGHVRGGHVDGGGDPRRDGEPQAGQLGRLVRVVAQQGECGH